MSCTDSSQSLGNGKDDLVSLGCLYFRSSGLELWIQPASFLQILHFVLNHVHILETLGAQQMGGSFLFPKPLTFSKKRWPRQCPQTGIKHRGCMPEDSSSYSRYHTNLWGTTSGCVHSGHVSQGWENRGSDLLGGYIPSLGNAETGVGRSACGK